MLKSMKLKNNIPVLPVKDQRLIRSSKDIIDNIGKATELTENELNFIKTISPFSITKDAIDETYPMYYHLSIDLNKVMEKVNSENFSKKEYTSKENTNVIENLMT
jgi:hypothetical protein